ncbi:methyltransferase domain-containing protein [Candidatus Arsenophonus nilaparvatae]|uniref:class I SAM-dependent methyltransferase n=1 Tax=Candidatus Arsenophonus nilaparvatae TaxID=1247023 RepID=UPI000509920E|nr:methyltransferase domain-containing protein [Candidatus Arsenophonus nilaparvatae]
MNNKFIDDVIEWDVNNWKECLSYWTKNSHIDINNSSVLELGGRNGGLSLWAAMNGANVICSDKDGPTNDAKRKHKKYNVNHLIQYKKVNALKIPYENELDVIMSKSILGALGYDNNITNQKIAISEIYRTLRKGGEFWFIENLIASPFHQLMRKKFIKWGDNWRYVSINEMMLFLNQFSSVKYKTFGITSCFGRNEKQRKMLSKLDKLILKITPKNWKYIILGVATK